MKITVEIEGSIDLSDHLDQDDVYQLMEEFDIGVPKELPEVLGDIDWKKLSLIDVQKFELFIGSFEGISLNDLETFLNKD